MAKKKEIKIESTKGVGPGADPSDPVAIIYQDELIGSLNDTDDEGVLKTGGTICENDIFVRYAGGGSGDSTVFILPFVLDEGNRYISTVKWNELSSAIEAQKIILPVIDNSTSELSLYVYGYSVSIGQGIMNGALGIGGSFKAGASTYQMEGTESDLNDPVTATMGVS